MSTTVSDADIRTELQRYLDAGEGGSDFDVDGILSDVMEIIREHGHTSIDSIDGQVFARILQRWDTSAPAAAGLELPGPQPRDGLESRLEAFRKFFADHPALREPYYCSMIVQVPTRAELDALAGHFGQQPPEKADSYDGAQFYVEVDGSFSAITFSWHAR